MNVPSRWTLQPFERGLSAVCRDDGLCVSMYFDGSVSVFWTTTEQQAACDPGSWEKLWDAVAGGVFPGNPTPEQGLVAFGFPAHVLTAKPEAFIAAADLAFARQPGLAERVADLERRVADLERR